MDLKNLMDQVVTPVNPTTTGELPAPEFAQLSEEDLLQIIGGANQGFEGSIFGPVPVHVEVDVDHESRRGILLEDLSDLLQGIDPENVFSVLAR